jgi:hypothetical protein
MVPVLSSISTSMSPRGLDRAARGGEHVVLHQAIHAGDADRREEPADGGRDQAHQQRDQRHHAQRPVEEARERLERRDGHQEDERERREQDRQRDLVRCLLPRGALDQRDHAIDEAAARILTDLDLDPVRQHARASGDRAAIASRLAHDRRRLAGDRALVDRRDPLEDLAVGRDHLPGGDPDHVPLAELGRPDLLAAARLRAGREGRLAPRATDAPRGGGGPHLPQRVGLRLAAPLGHRLGEIGEEHREPQPRDELHGELHISG